MIERAFREIAFIDPAISHLDLFVAGLRPGIEAVLLPREGNALAEIAAALEEQGRARRHPHRGAWRPGELSFAAGALTIKTIDEHRDELAQIGDALGSDGTILLWSCETGAGWQGACFVEALERATGAEIAAISEKIGAAEQGGKWDFGTERFIAAQAPLTTAAIQTYEGVMANHNAIDGTVLSPIRVLGRTPLVSPTPIRSTGGDFFNGGDGADTHCYWQYHHYRFFELWHGCRPGFQKLRRPVLHR